MSLEPHSPEFARLATRWLDGVATQEEAARLWAAIVASKACAAQFADHARFESLMEQTCAERAREQEVNGVVHKAVRKHHQRRVLKIAAIVLALGAVLRLIWPGDGPVMVHKAPAPVPPVAVKAAKSSPAVVMQPLRILVPPPKSPTSPPVAKPLQTVLDEFFLTSVSLDRVPLREAMLRLEEQLRALNYQQSAALASLRASLPAGAANQPVTFHSGAISYLKAVRAIAALANCEVQVSDVGLALILPVSSPLQKVQSLTIESLLANDGNGRHSDMSELLQDARALGLLAEGDIQPHSISGTRGQFAALAELASSRHQIRNLPDIGVLPIVYPMSPSEKGRALTEKEAEEQLRIATQNGTLKPGMLNIRPGTGAVTEGEPGGPDLLVSAVPSGPYMQVTISPNSERLAIAATDIVVPSIGGAALPLTSRVTGTVSVGAINTNRGLAIAGGALNSTITTTTITPDSLRSSNNSYVGSSGTVTLDTLVYSGAANNTASMEIAAGAISLNKSGAGIVFLVFNNGMQRP